MTEKKTYGLQEGIQRVVRSGLVLEGNETVEAYPDLYEQHSDVLTEITNE